MCVVYLGQNLSENIKLLVASNRDEFYTRPYSAISEWDNGIVAGRDEKENGTWLGFNKKGNFAFITNYRTGLKREDISLSRGSIVSNYLERGVLPKDEDYPKYGDFNFVFGSLKEIGFISNVEGNYRSSEESFSVSNGKLFNKWPKMEKLEGSIGKLDFSKSFDELKDSIFEHLSDNSQASDDILPSTGVGLEYERILSSVFIKSPFYGTVSQNISIVDANNTLHMFERDILRDKESYIKVQLGEL